MILATPFNDASLACSKGVHCQYKESEFRQTDATRLHVRILLCFWPVAMHAQHAWQSSRSVRDVGVSRHPHLGHSLEDDLLNAIAVALECLKYLGIQRAGISWKPAPRLQQPFANLNTFFSPLVERSGRLITGPHIGCTGLDKFQEGLSWFV